MISTSTGYSSLSLHDALPIWDSSRSLRTTVHSSSSAAVCAQVKASSIGTRSEEHTSELQSLRHLVCRLLLEKKKRKAVGSEPDEMKSDESNARVAQTVSRRPY